MLDDCDHPDEAVYPVWNEENGCWEIHCYYCSAVQILAEGEIPFSLLLDNEETL